MSITLSEWKEVQNAACKEFCWNCLASYPGRVLVTAVSEQVWDPTFMGIPKM